MSRTLRYQISDWSQITDCLSNNSKSLYLTLSKHLDGTRLRSLVLQVNHSKYGVLFAAMIKGTGTIITKEDEEGNDLPFLTTEQILRQIMKFGFYVTYDVKSNLPNNILNFLSTIDNLGFDKISRITVVERILGGAIKKRPKVVVFKSVPENEDLLVYGAQISEVMFAKKLSANILMNVTDEKDMQWDWLTYMANISDILDENVDPTDDFETETGIDSGYDDRPRPPYIYTHQRNSHYADLDGYESYEDPDADESSEIPSMYDLDPDSDSYEYTSSGYAEGSSDFDSFEGTPYSEEG